MRQGAVPLAASRFPPRPPFSSGRAGVPLAQTPPNVPARSLHFAGPARPRSPFPVPPAHQLREPRRLPARPRPVSLPASSLSLAPLPVAFVRSPPAQRPESFCPYGGGGDTTSWGTLRTRLEVSPCAEGLQGFDLFVVGFRCDFIFSFTVKANCHGSYMWSGSLGTRLLPMG